jgi:membrane-bound metal-dependent hydrolase YbcI (DUF457 family)
VSSLGSALLTAYGAARFGWDGVIPSLAFISGAAGGMAPDLDSDASKPLRLAGLTAGAAAAAGTAAFVSASGDFLNRPWGAEAAVAAAVAAFALFNFLAVETFRRLTRHRGLFHSLAVPFLYAGLMACLAAPYGADASMAVWLLGVFGVFSHLALDAAQSLSLIPLKLATGDLGASTRLWLVTAGVTILAFSRLTKI